MKTEEKIKKILRVDFPAARINRIMLYPRHSGIDMTMTARINGVTVAMSFLPEYSRKAIYRLINN